MNKSTFLSIKELFISLMCKGKAAFRSVSVDEIKTKFKQQLEKLRERIRRICSLLHLAKFSKISRQNAETVNERSGSSAKQGMSPLNSENKQKKKKRWVVLIGGSIVIALVAVIVVVFINYDRTAEYIVYENNAITVPGTDISYKMIPVEGGTFQMTSNDSLSVTLDDCCIGEVEVTQELWEAVMGSEPSGFKGANRPVEDVSWVGCQDFIKKLNEKTGKKFRLPTEAEWEYAARGGNKSQGYEYAGSNTIGEVAWYKGNARAVGESSPDYGTHPVGTKSPNELGLYDMSGNVWEWCSDSEPSNGEPRRMIRGGSWCDGGKSSRVDYRNNAVIISCDFLRHDYGLRLACDL